MKWRSLPIGARRACVAAGTLLVICVAVAPLFTDLIVNSMVKPRLVRAFTEAFPQYELHVGSMTVGILSNRVACDSLAVRTLDTSWSARSGPVALSGIDWWSVFRHGSVGAGDLSTVVMQMKQGALSIPGSVYELRFDSLRVSVADSTISLTLLSYAPTCEDEELFASSRTRQTRLKMSVPRTDVSGVACLDLLRRTQYRAHAIRLTDPLFDILLNKEKPTLKDSLHPMMPIELLSSIGVALRIDSLTLSHAVLRYGERFGVGAHPGVITLDSVQVLVERLANARARGDTVHVRVDGRFMNAGTMNARMLIPLAPQGLSYRYAGSLGGMRLAALNPFLERTEGMRITDGVLREAEFSVVVTAGHARGTVRAIYRDLTVAVINKKTGSEDAILDRIATMISNRVKIRRSNLPDRTGKSTIGVVRYDHRSDEAFVEFSWFALRSGVGDVVGF